MKKFDLPEACAPEPVSETIAAEGNWLNLSLGSGASVIVLVRQAGALRDGTLKRSLAALPNPMVRIGNPLASKLTVERMLIQVDGEPEDNDFDLEPAEALLANLGRREGADEPLLVVVDDAQTLAPDALDALALVPRAAAEGKAGRVLMLVGTQDVLSMIVRCGLASLQKPLTVILPQVAVPPDVATVAPVPDMPIADTPAPGEDPSPAVDVLADEGTDTPTAVSRPFSRSLVGDAPITPGLASLRVPPPLSAQTRLAPLKRARRSRSLWPFVLAALFIGGGYVAWSYYPRETAASGAPASSPAPPPVEVLSPPVEITPPPAPEPVPPTPSASPPPVPVPAVPPAPPAPVQAPSATLKAPPPVAPPAVVPPPVVPQPAAPRVPTPAATRPLRPSIPVLPETPGDKESSGPDRMAIPQELSPLPSMLGQLPELPDQPSQPVPNRSASDALRQGFDAFLNRAGADTEHLTPADRAALFQEYLAWRARNALPPVPASRVP